MTSSWDRWRPPCRVWAAANHFSCKILRASGRQYEQRHDITFLEISLFCKFPFCCSPLADFWFFSIISCQTLRPRHDDGFIARSTTIFLGCSTLAKEKQHHSDLPKKPSILRSACYEAAKCDTDEDVDVRFAGIKLIVCKYA
ncbi:unnamed protein product [Amoebophrya sp. A120]|nr:unnamed protein product [Amoebophrya sp. A120]|eukprot:GSA120T00003046001.1